MPEDDQPPQINGESETIAPVAKPRVELTSTESHSLVSKFHKIYDC